MSAPQFLPFDADDSAIIAAMGAALGFVPAEVIAQRIDREHGQVVAVLKRGSKLQWNYIPIPPPIAPPPPVAPIESAPESIVEASSEAAATIDVVEVPSEPTRRTRRPRKSA